MFSDERSKYKSWSNLKKQMSDLLCDSLKDRITYFYTRYHKDRGSFGRATINLDKSELIAFSWDVGIDIQWGDEYEACLENPDADQATVHHTVMNEKWMQQGALCHHDFLEAATTYLKIDISTALHSNNYILRVFAYMDRRVGKRTLIKIKDEVETLPAWVKQFYQIRCEAEGIGFPPEREKILKKTILNYDEEAQEADVFISDGRFELRCYAHPYIPDDSDKSEAPLSAFMTEKLMRALENGYKIEKLQNGYYSYHLQGKIIDLEKRLVTIGNITMKLDTSIPKDIREGEFIEFTVMRVDL